MDRYPHLLKLLSSRLQPQSSIEDSDMAKSVEESPDFCLSMMFRNSYRGLNESELALICELAVTEGQIFAL